MMQQGIIAPRSRPVAISRLSIRPRSSLPTYFSTIRSEPMDLYRTYFTTKVPFVLRTETLVTKPGSKKVQKGELFSKGTKSKVETSSTKSLQTFRTYFTTRVPFVLRTDRLVDWANKHLLSSRQDAKKIGLVTKSELSPKSTKVKVETSSTNSLQSFRTYFTTRMPFVLRTDRLVDWANKHLLTSRQDPKQIGLVTKSELFSKSTEVKIGFTSPKSLQSFRTYFTTRVPFVLRTDRLATKQNLAKNFSTTSMAVPQKHFPKSTTSKVAATFQRFPFVPKKPVSTKLLRKTTIVENPVSTWQTPTSTTKMTLGKSENIKCDAHFSCNIIVQFLSVCRVYKKSCFPCKLENCTFVLKEDIFCEIATCYETGTSVGPFQITGISVGSVVVAFLFYFLLTRNCCKLCVKNIWTKIQLRIHGGYNEPGPIDNSVLDEMQVFSLATDSSTEESEDAVSQRKSRLKKERKDLKTKSKNSLNQDASTSYGTFSDV